MLLIFGSVSLFAQACLENMPPGIPVPPANTKSYWNWKGDDPSKFDGTGNFYFRQEFSPNINLVSQFSPYSAALNQPNTNRFTNTPIDYEEADGWELAYRYFGEIQPCRASSTNTPFFAVYNRHSGILRIFITMTTNPLANGVAISIGGDPQLKNSASLSYGDEIIAPLQIFNNNPGEIKFINEAIFCGAGNNCKTWYYADFKIFYDPCICQNKVNWEIKFDLIQTQQLAWETNGIEEQILGPGTSSNKKATVLTIAKGVGGAISGAIKAGKQSYKEGESFSSDVTNWVAENNECFWKDGDDLLSKSGIGKLSSFLSIVPGVGAAFGAVNFLSTAFDFLKKDKGTVVTPYKSKINSTTEGQITIGVVPFQQQYKLPGSLKQERQECINGIENGPWVEDVSLTKPIYDRPLGVVSLITPVVMEYAEYHSDPVIRKITTWPFGGYDDERVTPNPVREYRLANDLKFAVNPASDLEIESVDAAFFFDFPNIPNDNCTNSGHKFALSDFGPFALGKYKPLGTHYLVEDPNYSNFTIENCGTAATILGDVKKRYNLAGFELFTATNRTTYCNDVAVNPEHFERVNLKNVTFKSATVPLQLLKTMTFKVFHDGSNPFAKIKFTIYLRHKISGKKFLEIVSYQVRSNEFVRSSLDPQVLKYTCDRYKSACESETGDFPQEVTLYQHYPTGIDPSPFQSCLAGLPVQIDLFHKVVSSSHKAIHVINLKSVIFSANSANPIEMKALEVNVSNEMEIPPFVTLVAGFQGCESPAPIVANLGDINSVCSSQAYISRANARIVASNSNILPTFSKSTLGYPIPNPTRGECSLSFNLAEESGYAIQLSNVLGETVRVLGKSEFSKTGPQSITFDTGELEAGVYFITFTAQGFRQARKLVVVR